jgi:signal transduction histidine kinase
MIDLVINSQGITLNENTNIQHAMNGLKKANQRAATIIHTLRNMFRNGNRVVTTFNFNDLVNDVVLISQSTLQRHAIELNVQQHTEPLRVTGDKSQLQQVLLNLITNACEAFPESFTPRKQVRIQTLSVNDHIELHVSDNGTGISPEIESNVFELLRTNKESGMGIGLWLSKSIVESHSGSIQFMTKRHHGTTFTVQLPLTSEAMYF